MEANTGCFTTCIPIGILCISLCDAAFSQTVRIEAALFRCSCVKGALSRNPVPARYPSRDHWGLSENWTFYPSPWRDLQPPHPYFPSRQNWMVLGEELANGKWWAPGISPGLTLTYRGAGIQGWRHENGLSGPQSCPGICPWQSEPCHPRCDGILHLLVVWQLRPLLASHNQISLTAFSYSRDIDNYQY